MFPHIYQFQRFDRYYSMSIADDDVAVDAVDAVDAVVPIASPGVVWAAYTYTNTLSGVLSIHTDTMQVQQFHQHQHQPRYMVAYL